MSINIALIILFFVCLAVVIWAYLPPRSRGITRARARRTARRIDAEARQTIADMAQHAAEIRRSHGRYEGWPF